MVCRLQNGMDVRPEAPFHDENRHENISWPLRGIPGRGDTGVRMHFTISAARVPLALSDDFSFPQSLIARHHV